MRDQVQLGRDARGADLVETRAVCEDFAECRTCLMCVRCRATVAFFTVCFLIFTCLTAGLALICCPGTLLTGAALCARTGAVNMVTAMSAAATFVRACTHKIAIGDSDLIKVRFAPLC